MATEPFLPGRDPLEDEGTAELVRGAIAEARELVKLEVELARDEVRGEVKQLQSSAVGFGVGAVAALLSLAMLGVALVLSLGGTPLAALGVAVGLLVVAGASAGFGYARLPRKPLDRTRRRLRADVLELKEHLA